MFDTLLFHKSTKAPDFVIWFFYFVSAMYLLTIIMNLLIAFIGDTYQNVVDKQISSYNFELTVIMYIYIFLLIES